MVSGVVLIYLLIALVVFLVAREFFCWYLKVNRTVALLEEIRDLLKHQARQQMAPPAANDAENVPLVFMPGRWSCKVCSGVNEPDDTACRYCKAARQA